LNFDMIGSENFIVGTLDSDGSDVPVPPDVNVPEGSAEREAIFTDYFDANDQPHVGTDFSGRSDYQAFIDNGVPASGLFSGADGIKTADEVEMFGGVEGVQHDRNYHSVDDTIENLSKESVDIFVPAIAFAAHTLAYDLVDEPTDDPTGEPTDDPTGEPTDDPTDDPADDPALAIAPETIGVTDFVDPDKGVALTVTGLEPGDDVDFTVARTSGQNTEEAVISAKADEDGVASTTAYGTNPTAASNCIGDDAVEVDGGDSADAEAGAEQSAADTSAAEDLSGSFSVVADEDAPGGGGDDGDDGDDGDGGGKLPRTGADALPLIAAAAALVLGGGALVTVTRNRRRS